ncbi:MAG TPA: lipid A-modifier LpxR family protein, partial [Stellaceae bacterium]|nr:lipid A-modifier LpxR family protein [Stellaceae bacterium]
YVFAAGEARAVGRNIFLDGNSFKSSASVTKIPAVGDAELGAAVFWRHYRLSYTWIYRSPEFLHQDGPDHYGSLNLTFHHAF